MVRPWRCSQIIPPLLFPFNQPLLKMWQDRPPRCWAGQGKFGAMITSKIQLTALRLWPTSLIPQHPTFLFTLLMVYILPVWSFRLGPPWILSSPLFPTPKYKVLYGMVYILRISSLYFLLYSVWWRDGNGNIHTMSQVLYRVKWARKKNTNTVY